MQLREARKALPGASVPKSQPDKPDPPLQPLVCLWPGLTVAVYEAWLLTVSTVCPIAALAKANVAVEAKISGANNRRIFEFLGYYLAADFREITPFCQIFNQFFGRLLF